MKSIHSFYIAACFLCLCLSACSKNDECIEVDYNNTFSFQQSDRVCPEAGIEIRFDEVIDQRCPCNVECVWEGEFLFRLTIQSGGQTREYLLHETLDNAPDPLTGLQFSEIERRFTDSCDNPMDIENMVFGMKIIPQG